MSRCFSFPPPGFVWNGVEGEALVDLIKVRREEAEAEKQRKKERRKRKRRKEDEEVEEGEIRQKRHSHHRRHKRSRSKDCSPESCHNMKKDQESDGPECSTITEELPMLVSDSVYESSDNSHNVWRKMPRLSPGNHGEHGSFICNDVSIQKHQDPASHGLSLHYTPTLDQLDALGKETRLQHIESTFREQIIGNWTPPTKMSEQPEFESDLEWLLTRRAKTLPQTSMSKTFNATSDGLCCSSSAYFPTVQYLPQVGIHAFPFIMPF